MPQINVNVFYDYDSQSFHPHAQKQPAKLSVKAAPLYFFHIKFIGRFFGLENPRSTKSLLFCETAAHGSGSDFPQKI